MFTHIFDFNLPGDVLRTYVFGAYTFEANPPFAIKTISDAPIVHETMYSGPWANLPRYMTGFTL